MSLTGLPSGGVPVAVPMLLYAPSTAGPEAVQVMLSPTSRVVFGQLTVTPWLSVTVTSVSLTLPMFSIP